MREPDKFSYHTVDPFWLKVASGTHPGKVRQVNQDTVYAWASESQDGEPRALTVVADGVGGQRAGEVASRIAVDALVQALEPMLRGDSITRPLAGEMLTMLLYNAISNANDSVRLKARTAPEAFSDMGTTLSCVLILGQQAIIGNIGDSRVYRLSSFGLSQITQDHSLVAALVAAGLLTPDEATHHPRRNVLTQVLGPQPSIYPDLKVVHLDPGDWLLLCSDGLWGVIQGEREMERLLRQSAEPQQAVRDLIAAANEGGGYDNIGLAVVEVVPGKPPQ